MSDQVGNGGVEADGHLSKVSGDVGGEVLNQPAVPANICLEKVYITSKSTQFLNLIIEKRVWMWGAK